MDWLIESTVRRRRNDQDKLFQRRTEDTPKYPELYQLILERFTEQRHQGEQMICRSTNTDVIRLFVIEKL